MILAAHKPAVPKDLATVHPTDETLYAAARPLTLEAKAKFIDLDSAGTLRCLRRSDLWARHRRGATTALRLRAPCSLR